MTQARDECWATTKACAYEDATILIAVNARLQDSAADFVDVLAEWDFSGEEVYKPVVRWWADNPDANTEDAALWWLRENNELWSEWVIEDAGAAIREALVSTPSRNNAISASLDVTHLALYLSVCVSSVVDVNSRCDVRRPACRLSLSL